MYASKLKSYILLMLAQIFFRIIVGDCNLNAQVTVSLGDSVMCQSGSYQISVPVRVFQFTGIGAVSLKVLYDTSALEYTGFNSSALSGNLIVNSPFPAGSIILTWFSQNPISLPNNEVLIRFLFTGDSSSKIRFSAIPGDCEIADPIGEVVNSLFNDSWVIVGGVQISVNPVSNLILNSDSIGLIEAIASGDSLVQWQVSSNSGANWTNLVNDSLYAGVSTNVLRIKAKNYMSGYQYRAFFEARGGCQPATSSICTLGVSSATTPTVVTNAASNITQTSAQVGGSISADGGSPILERGVVYSLGSNPTIADSIRILGIGIGTFTGTITGLNSNLTYNFRAFARNLIGTAYGNNQTFQTLLPTCPPTAVDVDGNVYHTIVVGTQCWMRNNLRVRRYRNLDSISSGLSNQDWSNITNGASALHSSVGNAVSIYGSLYNGYAARDFRGICPVGWRVPSSADLDTLSSFLGGNNISGRHIKDSLYWVFSVAVQQIAVAWLPDRVVKELIMGFSEIGG